MNSRTIAQLLIAAALLGAAAPVSAFERQTVDGAPERPLYWQRRAFDVYVGIETANEGSPAGIQTAALNAFTSWQSAGGCTDVSFEDAGMPRALTTNLDGGAHDGENRVIFRQLWPESASSTALALTTVVYDRRTGVIQDADIDLNDESFFWTTNLDGVTINDVENSLTHELGHFLGFAHVADPEATMYADSPEGETEKRSLAPDDIDAVCTVYPAGAPTPGVDPIPTGISRGALTSASSCAAAPIGARGAGSAWWLLVLLIAWGRTRPRQPPRRGRTQPRQPRVRAHR
jgi:hypothetical protein